MTKSNLDMNTRSSYYANLIELIDSCIEIIKNERDSGHILGGQVEGGLVKIKVPENLAVIGDLHGDMKSLQSFIERLGEDFISNSNNKIIFLGDYIDRGSKSIDVLSSICYLKQKYPNNIILMRGNHEAPLEFQFPSHDLLFDVTERFGEPLGKIIYKKFLLLFQIFPLVTIVEDCLLLVHAGLPTNVEVRDSLRTIACAIDDYPRNSTLEELLWNDPRSDIQNKNDWEYSRRPYGKYFGSTITRKWLALTGTKIIVRGHEPCLGFRIDHFEQVMTLFSCIEAYPKFEAAFLVISGNDLKTVRNAVDLSQYVQRVNT